MIFGVLKDIKEGENRVICTPVEVASIIAAFLLLLDITTILLCISISTKCDSLKV